ncbi:hypothetical protein SAY87_031996 [Trapa incisa]|uniref:Uncharacterized protein n=1 Tax=Trapa incisa TaxID=236973 RepID=A0AAN7KU97_9MYRT|nr:hypothetical protein SAY87_031996 [Trapa incisa]
MKGPSCAFVASMVAASTAAFSSSSSSDAGDRSAAYHVLPNPDSENYIFNYFCVGELGLLSESPINLHDFPSNWEDQNRTGILSSGVGPQMPSLHLTISLYDVQGYGSSSQRKFSAMDSSDKFAPRFDGLRFIETLVTAHR